MPAAARCWGRFPRRDAVSRARPVGRARASGRTDTVPRVAMVRLHQALSEDTLWPGVPRPDLARKRVAQPRTQSRRRRLTLAPPSAGNYARATPSLERFSAARCTVSPMLSPTREADVRTSCGEPVCGHEPGRQVERAAWKNRADFSFGRASTSGAASRRYPRRAGSRSRAAWR